MYEADGAIWLRTTDFDDDKDRVLVKADGELTYFASDTAYYVDKRTRGNDLCIYLLGADHHGYVNRLRAVAACAGDDPDTSIEVLIGQLVKMVKGGEEVRLSKRAGNIITLDDLVDEVGVDAARYSLIRYPVDSPLVLDVDLLLKRTNDNPVFYVQYGSARIASVLRNAAELGIDWRNSPFDPALLAHERENDLLGVLAEFPRIVASRRRAARAAPGRALPRGPGHRLPPVLRRVPGAAAGRRAGRAAARRPALAVRGVAAGPGQRPAPAGRLRARADVAGGRPSDRPSPVRREEGASPSRRAARAWSLDRADRRPRPRVAGSVGFWVAVYGRFARHRGTVLAGGLAFFALLSLVPAVHLPGRCVGPAHRPGAVRR